MSALTCNGIDERLIDYIYDELPPSEARQVQDHLDTCARCQAEVASFRRVRQAARSLSVEEPTEAASQSTERLLEAARQASAGDRPEPEAGTRPLQLVSSPEAPASRPGAPSSGASTTVAAAHPRRRRLGFVFHPAFAAAALFLVVGVGALYFVTFHYGAVVGTERDVAQRADEARPPTSPAAAPPPAEAPVPAPVAIRKLDEENPGDETKRQPAFVAPTLRREAAKRSIESSPLLPAADGVGAGSGRGRGAGGGVAAVAARPGARPEQSSAPAPPRGSPVQGHWLAPGQNDVLARAVEAGGSRAAGEPSGPAREERVADQPPAAPRSSAGLMATQAEEKARPFPAHEQGTGNTARDRAVPDESAESAGEPRPSKAKAEAPAPPLPRRAAPASSAPPSAAPMPLSLPSRAPVAPSPVPAAPPGTRATGTKGSNATVTDLQQQRLAQFRAAAQGDCTVYTARYQEIRSLDPGYRFATRERLDVARCFEKLGRFADARSELHALRDDAPGLAREIDQELDAIAAAEAARRQRSAQPRQPDQTAEHGASKKPERAAKRKPAAPGF